MEKYNSSKISASKRKHLRSIQQSTSKHTRFSNSPLSPVNPSVNDVVIDNSHGSAHNTARIARHHNAAHHHIYRDDDVRFLTAEENSTIDSSSCTSSEHSFISSCNSSIWTGLKNHTPFTTVAANLQSGSQISKDHIKTIRVRSDGNTNAGNLTNKKGETPISQNGNYGKFRGGRTVPKSSASTSSLSAVVSRTRSVINRDLKANNANGGDGEVSEDSMTQCDSADSSFPKVGDGSGHGSQDLCSLGGEDGRVCPTSYKAYHRQIEKRRRNKISALINEMTSLVPMCLNPPHRLDKLSVLEYAVQYVRVLTNTAVKKGESAYKPAFMSEDEIKYLLESTGFLLVLNCDKAQILHISDSIPETMFESPKQLLGRSMLDIVHPKDVALLKSMLTPYPNVPAVGSESMHTGKAITGCKRSFYARLKTQKHSRFNQSLSTPGLNLHTIGDVETIPVHITGFLKTWNDLNEPQQTSTTASKAGQPSDCACFIGLVKPVTSSANPYSTPPETSTMSTITQASASIASEHTSAKGPDEEYKHYWSRHTADAKYLSVDQRVFSLSGYLPQELVGNSEYNFVHEDDMELLNETYRQALANKRQECVISDVYHFKMKHGGLLPMRTIASSLFNPFTHELEFITRENYVIGNWTDNSLNENMFPSTSAVNSRKTVSTGLNTTPRQHERMEVDFPRQELPPVITSQTLNVLSGCGLDPEILTKLMKIQCVSTCTPRSDLLRSNSRSGALDSGVSSGDNSTGIPMLSAAEETHYTRALKRTIKSRKKHARIDKSSSGCKSGNEMDD